MDSTYASNYNSSDSLGAMMGGMFMLILLASLIVSVVVIVSMWKLYGKANKPGWAAIVPYYNTVVMLEVIGRPIWWFLVMAFVPFVGLWFSIVVALDFAKSYGKSTGFGVLLILVPFVGYPLLAFSKGTRYVGPVADGLDGFTPAPDREPTPGSPTNSFTVPPAFVPPAPAPAVVAPAMSTSPFMTTELTASAAPVVPVMSIQSSAPVAPTQTAVDELVASSLPSIEEPLPVAAPPLMVPPVAPDDVSVAPAAPAAPSNDPGQPTPPQL